MKKLYLLITLPLLLAGCGNSNELEIQQWMEKTKQETMQAIPKLKQAKDFVPFNYDKKDQIDPFNSVKLQSALAKMNPGSGHGIKPNLDRRREALELYPLDTLKMVGTITQGGNQYALIQYDGKGVMQVKAGNYVGLNYGLVTKVNEDSVEIK